MALSVRCQCGTSYDLKDEYAGQLIRCPKCHAVSRVERPAYTPTSQADRAFDRDLFLFAHGRQRVAGPYTVSSESGTPIVLVTRQEHALRTIVALFIGCAAMMFVLLGIVVPYTGSFGKGVGPTALVIGGGLAAFLIPRVVAAALVPKRHIILHRHERKRERLLEIVQDRALQLVVVTYTVHDAAGQPIARLRRTVLNALRRRWEVRTLADHLAFVATEPSLFDALRCRVVGALRWLGRAHLVVYAQGGRGVLGEFRADPTTFDRYVLDLRRDRHRKLDRRVALALGVMLDLGEERR